MMLPMLGPHRVDYQQPVKRATFTIILAVSVLALGATVFAIESVVRSAYVGLMISRMVR